MNSRFISLPLVVIMTTETNEESFFSKLPGGSEQFNDTDNWTSGGI